MIQPNSPYSASKASADLLCRAYYKTYNIPIVVTRCSNNYGPYQFPEKLIPLVMRNALSDIPIPIYGDGMQIRDWLFVEDHCKALLTVLEKGEIGSIYNVGGGNEITNISLVRLMLKILDKPESLITYVKDRPGHDRRYSINSSYLQRKTGWHPKWTFEQALPHTVDWYLQNQGWVQSVISGDYLEYYYRQYGKFN